MFRCTVVEVGDGIDAGEGESNLEEAVPMDGDQGEGEGEEAKQGQREEEGLSSEQKRLRSLINDSINEKLQQLQVLSVVVHNSNVIIQPHKLYKCTACYLCCRQHWKVRWRSMRKSC